MQGKRQLYHITENGLGIQELYLYTKEELYILEILRDSPMAIPKIIKLLEEKFESKYSRPFVEARIENLMNMKLVGERK